MMYVKIGQGFINPSERAVPLKKPPEKETAHQAANDHHSAA